MNYSYAGANSRVVTKMDNKKYKTMLMKQGNCLELESTQQTHVPRYSPYSSRNPSPLHARRVQNGLQKDNEGDYSCNTRLLTAARDSRSPSPLYADKSPS
jgi:hypothetical protein